MKRLFALMPRSAISRFLQRFVPELQIKLMSGGMDTALVQSLKDSAVRFRHMVAIGETALTQYGFEFGKRPLQHALGEMVKAKLLESR